MKLNLPHGDAGAPPWSRRELQSGDTTQPADKRLAVRSPAGRFDQAERVWHIIEFNHLLRTLTPDSAEMLGARSGGGAAFLSQSHSISHAPPHGSTHPGQLIALGTSSFPLGAVSALFAWRLETQTG